MSEVFREVPLTESEPRVKTPEMLALFRKDLLGVCNLGSPALAHAEDELEPRVSGRNDILIVPHANQNMPLSVSRVADVMRRLGAGTIRGLDEFSDPKDVERAIIDAQAIYLTGGNTATLVTNLHAARHTAGRRKGELVDPRPQALKEPIADLLIQRAREISLIGTSAGLMVMADDVRTWRDTATILQQTEHGQVARLDGLGLIPRLNLHPHYNPEEHDEVFEEHFVMNPDMRILALRNGGCVVVNGDNMRFAGISGGVFMEFNSSDQRIEKTEIRVGDNISQLLQGSHSA